MFRRNVPATKAAAASACAWIGGALAAAALVLAPACTSISAASGSVSESSETLVHSVSTSSRSVSDSSGGGTRTAQNYGRDVHEYAVAWLERGELADGDAAARDFALGLGRVAELHGVSTWESQPETCAALAEVVQAPTLDDARRQRLQETLSTLGIDVAR